jgi:Ca2+-binding RTX toxin-like protein
MPITADDTRVRLALALTSLLLLAAPAQAATVEVSAGALRITAQPGETNAIDIGPGATVADSGAPLTLGPGCMPQGIEALCVGATRVEADLSDSDDVLTLSAPLPADLNGGEGNDSLTVIAAVATLDGGLGNDTLTAATGADALSGGPGFDTLTAGEGDDRLDGGTGGDAADGGGGADSIVLRDRLTDTATCGAGRDTVRAEVLDQLDFACERVDYGPPGNAGRLRPMTGGGRFVPIPGQSWARVDRRILPDVLYLIRRYHVQVGDGYAIRGHKRHGEHPLGLAVDLYPGPGGSWREVARLARWAEPRQNRTRPPFRWVGWNGDRMHGDPAHCKPARGCPPHLHLSWDHTPGRPRHPVRTVWVFDVRAAP